MLKIKKNIKILINAWDKLNSVYSGIVGNPDYDEYVKHIKTHHQDEKPLSKAEFYKLINDKRGKRPRCC